MSKKITEDTVREIRDFYLKRPISIGKVSEMFGYCVPTIRKILGPDIKIWPKNTIYNPDMKEDYFDRIDNEFKAYFLGLIIADGNIYDPTDKGHSTQHKGQKWVSITLQDRDSYMLEIFRRQLGLSSKVASDGRGSSYVAARSDRLAEGLGRFGLTQRKSFNTSFPFMVDRSLHRHIMRGIIDGDGTIDGFRQYTPKDNRNRFKHKISCCGTHRLMSEMVDVIMENLKLRFRPSIYDYRNKSISQFNVQNIPDMHALGMWLYDGSHVFLERKRSSFSEFSRFYGLSDAETFQDLESMFGDGTGDEPEDAQQT